MTNMTPGDNSSNPGASTITNAPKTISPAARKFAEYLSRRTMIEHAARNNVPEA